VGQTVEATVIELRGERAAVQIAEPAVTTTAPVGLARPGDVVRLRVVRVDIATGEIELAV
jgi:hypothetical protein